MLASTRMVKTETNWQTENDRKSGSDSPEVPATRPKQWINMELTKISWTTHTFNPWIGCSKLSPGCENCFAAAGSKKYGVQWGPGMPRRRTSPETWQEPIKWNRIAESEGDNALRVFSASLCDVFDTEVEDQWREDLFALIRQTPRLHWQLLTKRSSAAVKYAEQIEWPANAWIGTSIEDQARAYRARDIVKIPAPVRFLSMEPLLEPVKVDLNGIDWVIVGGESGRNHRSMMKAWVLDIQKQCADAKVPFFFKQWAAFKQDGAGHELNGEVFHAFPVPVQRVPVNKPKAAAKNQTEVVSLAE